MIVPEPALRTGAEEGRASAVLARGRHAALLGPGGGSLGGPGQAAEAGPGRGAGAGGAGAGGTAAAAGGAVRSEASSGSRSLPQACSAGVGGASKGGGACRHPLAAQSPPGQEQPPAGRSSSWPQRRPCRAQPVWDQGSLAHGKAQPDSRPGEDLLPCSNRGPPFSPPPRVPCRAELLHSGFWASSHGKCPASASLGSGNAQTVGLPSKRPVLKGEAAAAASQGFPPSARSISTAVLASELHFPPVPRSCPEAPPEVPGAIGGDVCFDSGRGGPPSLGEPAADSSSRASLAAQGRAWQPLGRPAVRLLRHRELLLLRPVAAPAGLPAAAACGAEGERSSS